jgi:hypothetical protein
MGGLDPGAAVGGQSTCGDQKVGMRMVVERARPGVQDRQNAGRAADPGRVLRERLDGGGGFT